ncbi:HEXXH motif domain-containing protein [Longispora urticae]
MTVPHRLPGRDFALLAAGQGDATTVRHLRAGQLSKRLHQLHVLAPLVPAEAFELLAAAHEAAPGPVTDLLADPGVGGWAGRCVRRRHDLDPVDAGYAAAVAAVAAHRAGLDFRIAVPGRGGSAFLPTLGRRPAGTLARDDLAELAGGGGTGPVEALWRLRASAGGLDVDVVLDDLDPYRDLHGLGAAPRLTRDEVAVWRDRLRAGWELLVTDHRPYAEAAAAGLRVLVPLRADGASRGVSATSMDAFGAVLLSPPSDAAGLAVAVLHEFQHAKLGALMDLIPLHHTDEALYYAPWRDDPRPLDGLLHGAYAFLGVTDFWRVRRATDGLYAQFEFARWRERVGRVLDVLATGNLAEAGRAVLAGMRDTMDRWQTGEPVPDTAEALAADAAEDHQIGWRLRNLRPDRAAVATLAARYARGEDRPDLVAVDTETLPGVRALVPNVRRDLTGLRIADPDRFVRLSVDPAEQARLVPGATAADLAHARADYPAAAAGYRDLLLEDPDRAEHWAGLVLAEGHAAGATFPAPELLLAVHRALRPPAGAGPDPLALLRWMSAGHNAGGSTRMNARLPDTADCVTGCAAPSTSR